MVRLSEIIRKTEEKKSKDRASLVSKATKIKKDEKTKRNKESIQAIQKIYEDAILQINQIMNDIIQGKAIKGREVVNLAKKIVERIRINSDILLSLVNKFSLIEKEDKYLYTHSVNVSILAANLGLALGYNKNGLVDLCTSSLLHDIGMLKIPQEVITKPEKLTEEEYDLVRKHPSYGLKLLDNIRAKKPLIYGPKLWDKIKNFASSLLHDIGMLKIPEEVITKPEELAKEERDPVKKHPTYGLKLLDKINSLTKSTSEVICQHHEKIDGTGYPEGKRGEEISEHAKIVAIADIYEALTHPRPYRRSRILPCDAVKMIVQEAGSSFDPKLVKVFLNYITCYPVGSFVLLNNNEIGRVILTNENLPLRPVVEIVFDSGGKPPEQPKRIDLAKSPVLSIKKAIDECNLQVSV